MTLLALGVLVTAIAVSATTLLRAPIVYGDEPWIASEIASWVGGTGLRPSIFVGSGLYDHAQDIWNPYLGTLPFVFTAVVAPASLLAYRLTAFLIDLGALAAFGWALRAEGRAIAAAACATLATSWGFFAASHYVRWDSLAFLIVALTLGLLQPSAPNPRRALVLGMLLGAAADVQLSVLAMVPGVAVLIGWERPGRRGRLIRFGGGLAGLLLLYVTAHYLVEPAEAQRQFGLLLADTYRVPLQTALATGHVGALVSSEASRYQDMWRYLSPGASAQFASLLILGAGALACGPVLARVRSPYPARGVAAVLMVSYVIGLALIQGNKTAGMYGWYALPLAIATLASALREVPSGAQRALGRPIPMVGLLLGVGLLAELVLHIVPRRVAAHHLLHEWVALPLAIPLLAGLVARRRGGRNPALAPLLGLALAGGAFVIDDVRHTQQVVSEPALAAAYRQTVHRGELVIGEPAFWWVDSTSRFRSNSLLWLAHRVRGRAPIDSLRMLCPDVVVYDDTWRDRYLQHTAFPSVAPTDPAERPALESLLTRDYALTRAIIVAGDHIDFWRRRPTACPLPS